MSLYKSTICGIGAVALAALAFGAWGDAPLSARRAQGEAGGLFVEAPQRFLRNARIDRTIVRSRQVDIDFTALADPAIADIRLAARPTILLNLFNDTSFAAVRDRIDQAEAGFTWVGHIPGIDLSTVTLASVDGVVAGSIVMPEAVYAIRYVGAGIHEVAQIDQSQFASELDPIPVSDADQTTVGAPDVTAPTVMSDDGSTIDVLVLYTPAATAAAGGGSAMTARVNLGISEANSSYINSGITQRLRLVNSQQVTYSENSALATDLYAVSNRYGSTPIGDTAAALRNSFGADLVMLVTSPTSPDGCGVAWLISTVSSTMDGYGFSVVEQSCISPNYSFAHELGHNMGARHDWFMDSGTTPYTYAHGYVDSSNRFRTVMSYNNACSTQGFNCTRLLYWSNPSVHSPSAYGSASMGIAGGTKSDCPTTTASNMACDADDHRALNNTAFTVANFRQAGGIAQTPVITWTGLSSVVAGTALGSAQLNATATVNGVAVPGTFVYNPSSGTVLAEGTRTLSVTFTPTNLTVYTTATRTVTMLVCAAGAGFVGPPSGGWSGTISGSNFVYNGRTFPIVNGRVNFPDCTTYIVAPNGSLMGGSVTPSCTSSCGGTSLITPTITWPTPASVTVGTALSATQLNASSGGVAGNFVYTPALAAVMNTVGNQTLSVTFTPTNSATYGSATATVTLQVTSGSFVGPANGGGWSGTISGSNLLYNGGTYPILNGRVSFPDCTTYIVGPNGALMGGSATPNCTPGGGLITPTITWATPAAVTVGTQLSGTQLNASASASGSAVAGTFVYTPSAGTSMNTVGNQTLSVTFTPTNTSAYASAGASVTLSVTSGGGSLITPTITWATPAAVTVGTVLGGTQLNASASASGSAVAGTFVFSPPAGTAMNTVGNQTLSVTFTPANTSTYAAASGSVTLSVTSSGSSFVGPAGGGGWSGTISGSNLLYGGGTYPIVNGRVNFPDCTTYIVAPNGALMGGSATPNCTPGGGGGGGGGSLITPTITWGPLAAITQGTALGTTQLNASSGGVSGSFLYSPNFGAVLGAGTQTLSVTFTPTDGATYSSVTTTTTLVVTASGGGGGSSFVGPANGGGWSGTISGSNLLYRGGTYPIVNGRVNFPDCTTYIVAPNGALMGGSATPNCTPGGGGGLITPTITWATPAAVAVGTALSTTQLNASTGGIAGTLVYTPSLGTVMNTVGSQTLSVTFTPTDGATYAAATRTVQLQVNGVGGAFVGPWAGGGWSGTISGSNLIYNNGTYQILNGRVSFPDCTMFIVAPNGALMGGSVIPNCTPADR